MRLRNKVYNREKTPNVIRNEVAGDISITEKQKEKEPLKDMLKNGLRRIKNLGMPWYEQNNHEDGHSIL